jgi:urease accessory protein
MRARAEVVATRAGLSRLRSEAPLALRPAAGALWLVGSAAGPLGGDDLRLDLDVGPGARLTLRTVAAAVVLSGPSRWTVTARVAAGGHLEVRPEPTVVTRGADHVVEVRAEVAEGGRFLLREELVLGRHGEQGGRLTARTTVDLGGAPLLRHEVVLAGGDPLTASPAVLGGARAYGSVLRCGTEPGAPRTGPGWAALALDGPGELVTAVGATAGELRRRLDSLDRTDDGSAGWGRTSD